jgi:hypothetical protein
MSFIHAVRMIKRKRPQTAALPLSVLSLGDALLREIVRGRSVSGWDRSNLCDVKCKMSYFNVRYRGAVFYRPHQPWCVLCT